MRLSTICRCAAELIAPEGAWTQGCSARDRAGNPVGWFDSAAVSFCGLGATARVGDGQPVVHNSLLSEFNDAPDTTQADVVTYLLLASEALKSEGR